MARQISRRQRCQRRAQGHARAKIRQASQRDFSRRSISSSCEHRGSRLRGIEQPMKAITVILLIVMALMPATLAVGQTNSLILGYSGSGISTDLRRVMDIEKIWEKHGLSVKSVYF